MSFLDNLIGEFTHQNQGQGQEQRYNQGQDQGYGNSQQQYPQQTSYSNQGPPQVPPPWTAEWDAPANRWIFINRENGERSFSYPQLYTQQGYGGGGGYGNPQEYGGGAGYEQRGQYYQEQPKNSHSGRNMALAGAAGLAGGALLMHEGEKVEEHWDEDKYRVEQKFDDGIADVEDAPEDVAQWTGRKVQDVEDIPGDVEGWKDREEYRAEQKWDNGVQDVEDAPEEIARWTGRKVQDVEDIPQDIEGRFDNDIDRVEGRFDDGRQDVERFDDRVDNAYDDGREQGRDDDRW